MVVVVEYGLAMVARSGRGGRGFVLRGSVVGRCCSHAGRRRSFGRRRETVVEVREEEGIVQRRRVAGERRAGEGSRRIEEWVVSFAKARVSMRRGGHYEEVDELVMF